MILVDTSVWIDHFHHSDPVLVSLLHEDEIGSHPLVAEELAMGSLRARDDVLKHLAHLLGSVTLVPGARLWTRDKRLLRAAEEHGVSFTEGTAG